MRRKNIVNTEKTKRKETRIPKGKTSKQQLIGGKGGALTEKKKKKLQRLSSRKIQAITSYYSSQCKFVFLLVDNECVRIHK